MRKVLLALVVCCGTIGVLSADDMEKKEKGKVILSVFSAFYSGFGSVNDERGFELDRASLGYKYHFTDELEVKAVMDFGRSRQVEDNHRIGVVKNAQVTWKPGRWELNVGLISTIQFKVQENFWGKRYIMKSFQDEYKLGSSADLGISVGYDWTDKVRLEAMIANGEGYKQIQVGRGLQYAAGMTLSPFSGGMIRLYGAYNEASEKEEEGMTNLAGFIGYQREKISIGGEYNYQFNAGHVRRNELWGTSLYATFHALLHKLNFFCRWDVLRAVGEGNWENAGMNTLLGAEFCLGKHIRLAPNVRIWLPEVSGRNNQYYFYLNASFKL